MNQRVQHISTEPEPGVKTLREQGFNMFAVFPPGRGFGHRQKITCFPHNVHVPSGCFLIFSGLLSMKLNNFGLRLGSLLSRTCPLYVGVFKGVMYTPAKQIKNQIKSNVKNLARLMAL